MAIRRRSFKYDSDSKKLYVDGQQVADASSGTTPVVSGNLSANTQTNITSVGTLSNLAVTGNLTTNGAISTSTTLSATGIIFANSTINSTHSTNGALVVAGGVGIGKDIHIGGNLIVSGTQSIFNTVNSSFNDGMIYLADGNTNDILDLGFVTAFTRGTYQHSGLVRDANDQIWKLFAGVDSEPTTTVDFGNATWSPLMLGNLLAQGNVVVGANLRLSGALLTSSGSGGSSGQFLTSTATGIAWTTLEVSTNSITEGDNNIIATAEYVNVAINSSNIASFSNTGLRTSGLIVSGSTAVDLNSASTDFALGLKVGRYITGQSGSKLSVTNQSNGIYLEGGSNAVLDLTGTTATMGQSNGTGTFTVQMATTSIQGTQESTGTGTGALRVSGGAGVVGSIYVNSANNPIAIGNGGTNGFGNIGASSKTFNTVFAKASSAQYADLAEVYRSDRNYIPGTVLVFGGTSEVTVSLISHDPTVAGVVSTNPAYLMNDREEGSAVALQGRVPCRVLGPVSRGDRVVTSDVRGVAERLDMAKYQPGCIIGKSLGSVPDGEIATIEVVVGRN